uniref:CAP-Gly domain-containing protein n=1 Tax=Trichuris muris TaxID=70415 RepID=A0A5S6Q0S4_TRIMR
MDTHVELSVSTDNQEFNCLRRFPLSITVGELKKRVELLVGIPYKSMTLQLRAQDGAAPSKLLPDNSAVLNTLSIMNGMILHVHDERGARVPPEESFNAADEVAFHLSDEKYNQKKNTVRSWLREQKWTGHEKTTTDKSSETPEKVNIKLQRCIVHGLQGQPIKPGRVAYIGDVHFKPGVWIGVHFDDAVGKNDGSVDGHRYFDCPPNYGSFVKPQFVEEEAEEI